MDPTSLPTDNLYKFMALSGIAVAFFSVYIGLQARYRIDDRAAQRQIELAQLMVTKADLEMDRQFLRAEQDAENAESDRLSERLRKRLNELHELDQAGKLTLEIHKEAHDEFIREFERYRAERKDLMPKVLELRDRTSKLAATAARGEVEATVDIRLAKEQNVIAWLVAIATALGATLSVFGFRLWYERLQKHLDKAAAAAALQNAPTKPTPE